MTHENLLAGSVPPTQLPDDPAATQLAAAGGRQRFGEIIRENPASSLCWALLAEGALAMNTPEGDVAAYAYARTGYHRGLDALRRSGWKGSGPVPWEHAANRGFLRALAALAQAADRIGETDEAERCQQFLRDCSETAWRRLGGPSSPVTSPAPERQAPPAEPKASAPEAPAAQAPAQRGPLTQESALRAATEQQQQ